MSEANHSDEQNESPTNNEISKLKKLLKRIERLIKQRYKTRSRCIKIISKLRSKQKHLIDLKEKCDNKIEKHREHKEEVRSEIRQRHHIKFLVRKKRLERLKLMSKFKKSLRKIYLKELRSVKRLQKLSKKSKIVNPKIKKIIEDILKLIEERDLVDKKIQKLTPKIEKFKKKKNYLGIRTLKRKTKAIRLQLEKLMLAEQSEIDLRPASIKYEQTPETKIIEFHTERKRPSNAIAPTRMPSIDEPEPIGDKKSTEDSSSSKKKIFIKRRKKTKLTKIEEPLPIGDKKDEEDKRDVKKKAKRKRRNFFSRSRRSLKSESEPITPTSDSDFSRDAQPKKRVLHKKKLHKRPVSTDSYSTEPITSLKTTTTDNDSEILKRKSIKKSLQSITSIKTTTTDNEPEMKPNVFNKPVIKNTLHSFTDRMKPIPILMEDENENLGRKSRSRIRVEKKSVVGLPNPVTYDDKYYQNLVKTQSNIIQEKIKSDRKKALLEQQIWNQEEAEAELHARESMEQRAVIRKSRQTLVDPYDIQDPLEELVEMGLKSKFFLTDIIPEEVPVVDDQILKIASQSRGLRGMLTQQRLNEQVSSSSASSLKKRVKKSKMKKIVIDYDAKSHGGTTSHKKTVQISDRPLFDRKPIYSQDDSDINLDNVSSGSESSLRIRNKKSKNENDMSRKKSVQISDRPFFDRKPAHTQDDSDDETLLAVSNLWNYKDPQPKPLPKPIIKDSSTKIDKSRQSQTQKPLEVIKPPSDGKDVVEHVLKAVCSACGMTDMILGGSCCPLIPKTE